MTDTNSEDIKAESPGKAWDQFAENERLFGLQSEYGERGADIASEKKDVKRDDGAMDDDELDRIIREMEEEDARREKEEAEHMAKKKADEARQQAIDESMKTAKAAENDRKLREQEREMERIEEEKERLRKERGSSGEGKSVAELLKENISDLTPGGQ